MNNDREESEMGFSTSERWSLIERDVSHLVQKGEKMTLFKIKITL